KQNIFRGGFEKIILNFPGTHGQVAAAACNSLRINTSSDAGNAMKVREIGVHNRDVCQTAQVHPACSLVLGRSMYPITIQNNVIGRRGIGLLAHKVVVNTSTNCSSNFEPGSEPVVIGS